VLVLVVVVAFGVAAGDAVDSPGVSDFSQRSTLSRMPRFLRAPAIDRNIEVSVEDPLGLKEMYS
jgi:hypothetical protein